MIPRHKYIDIKQGGSNLDFLIIDHGCVNDKRFDRKEFLYGGIPILVGGVKANELAETEKLFMYLPFLHSPTPRYEVAVFILWIRPSSWRKADNFFN